VRPLLQRLNDWADDHYETISTCWGVGWIAIIIFGVSTERERYDPLMGALVMLWLSPLYLFVLYATAVELIRLPGRLMRAWRAFISDPPSPSSGTSEHSCQETL
jgi:hypothetical protein